MQPVAEPGNELRFTRAAQATGFWLAAAVLVSVAVTLLASSVYRGVNPQLPHPAWALLPAVAAAFAIRTAVRLTRHAYVILSPVGVEIFPFLRPAANMRLIPWREIDSFEIDHTFTVLTLHHDAARTSGVHLSLKPIPADRRHLLAKALQRRIGEARPS